MRNLLGGFPCAKIQLLSISFVLLFPPFLPKDIYGILSKNQAPSLLLQWLG
jgi:hypothetical protein